MYDSQKYVNPPNDIQVPCLTEKCILFPSCLNKKIIGCSKLVDYVSSLSKEGKYDEAWNYVNSIFKRLVLLEDETKDNGRYNIMTANRSNFYEVLAESKLLHKITGEE